MNQPTLLPAIDEAIDRLGPLLEPARRRVFGFVASTDRPVTRDETASATGLALPLATFHLEKLLEAGLLEAAAAPVTAAGGRRRGRPSKLYRAARRELVVNLPARDYRLAAELFGDALAQSSGSDSLESAARARGRKLGERAASRAEGGVSLEAAVVGVLVDQGYEPRRLDDGSVALRNCPFDGLTESYGELICPANLSLLAGLLEGAGVTSMRTALEPGDGRCCVVLRAAGEG
jgi:predicted ArsR family transcriptional regulator